MGLKRLLERLVAAAATVGVLAAAPPALAQTDATWTGASTSSTLWSNPLNWSGATAPSGAIRNLTFGDLAFCDVGSAVAGAACYTSVDNLGPDTVGELTIGGGQRYQINPTSFDIPADTITLEGNGGTPNVGLNAGSFNGNNQLANFGIPIVLGAAQEWDIAGGIVYLGSISGSYPLTLNLSNGYVQANDVENSIITMSGAGELQLTQFSGSPELLPAITINDVNGTKTALAVATPNATATGPLLIQGTSNNFIVLTDHAPGETVLHVNGGVTLDSSTNVEFDLDGNNTTPGIDSSELTASGTVNLNGAAISLWQAESSGSCVTPTPGTTYTVVSAGSLNGNLVVGGQTVAPGGSATETLSTTQCSNVTTKAIVTYGTNAITATITGPPAAAGQGPRISGATAVGDALRVSSNGSWSGGPAPTYGYRWYSCGSKSCSPINGATRSSYKPTGADTGKTVEVKVTATNSYGSASAFSNTLGPVTPATAISPALKVLIRADLNRLGHPAGRRAVDLLMKTSRYRTRFRPPAAGTLTVVWSTTVKVGRGKHAKHRTEVVAHGIAHASGTHVVTVTIWVIGAGHALLRKHPSSLRTTATERFVLARGGRTTLTKRFTL
jgi:hypothetical protein